MANKNEPKKSKYFRDASDKPKSKYIKSEGTVTKSKYIKSDEDRENVYGLFADNDTTVNCEDVFCKHYKNVIHFHGEHRLNRQVIEEVLVPLIKEIMI